VAGIADILQEAGQRFVETPADGQGQRPTA